MKTLLKNNVVVAVGTSFDYVEGAWESPQIRFATLTDPNLTQVESPEDAKEGWVFDGVVVVHIERMPAAEERSVLARQIDADTDVIYRAVQGDRGAEYALAEIDAIAYTEAGYTGAVPASVASWAAAKGQTGAWAAQSILTTATQWRGAQSAIRATRLMCKEQAKTADNLATVEASWAAFVVTIRTALGLT